MKSELFEKRLLELGYIRGRRDRNRGRGYCKTVTEHDWTPGIVRHNCRRTGRHSGERVVRYWRGHRTVKCLHCTKTFDK